MRDIPVYCGWSRISAIKSSLRTDLQIVGEIFGDLDPMGFITIFRKHLGNIFFPSTKQAQVDELEALLYCILSSDRSMVQDRDEIYYGAYVRDVFFSVSFTNAIMTLKANIYRCAIKE